jgi:hypothetical protein
MKKYIAVAVLIIGGVSCKEALPPIDFSEPVRVLIDSAYTVENASSIKVTKRGILIEDLTGVRCVACPNAAAAATSIKLNDEDDQVVILGLYTTAPPSFATPFENYQDLRTDAAQNIGSNIYAFSNLLPAGGVNRTPLTEGESINISYPQWQSLANRFTDDSAIVNIDVSHTFVNDSTVELIGNFEFREDANAEPFVAIFLLEDDIAHPQKYSGGINYDYIHKHVVRKAYTAYNGIPLFGTETGLAIKGGGLKKGWELNIPDYVDAAKASIVLVVSYNDGENKQVIQCTEVKLK